MPSNIEGRIYSLGACQYQRSPITVASSAQASITNEVNHHSFLVWLYVSVVDANSNQLVHDVTSLPQRIGGEYEPSTADFLVLDRDVYLPPGRYGNNASLRAAPADRPEDFSELAYLSCQLTIRQNEA